MNLRVFKSVCLAFAAVVVCLSATKAQADVINIDMSAVDPSAIDAVREAEAIWEARIQAYSTEIPRGLRDQLSSLTIVATVSPVDGVGGILGFAGPTAVLTMQTNRNYAVAAVSQMTFDLDDFPSLEADGILVSVIAHEMGHAMGFGTLFAGNDLIGAIGGFGQTEYINGPYGINGYRTDIENPLAAFIPLEQRGGGGTALGHWFDRPPFFNQVFTPAFTKEIMTGFACDLDPDTGAVVCAPNFVAECTFGAFADLGWAVEGFNGAFKAPRGRGTGRWPKITAQTGTSPFGLNGVPPSPGVGFKFTSVQSALKHSLGSKGSGVTDVQTEDIADPFKLRRHSWSK